MISRALEPGHPAHVVLIAHRGGGLLTQHALHGVWVRERSAHAVHVHVTEIHLHLEHRVHEIQLVHRAHSHLGGIGQCSRV